jgi:putative endonuclease
MKFKVYILKSIAFGRFYIGSTSDLEKRIEFHNSKRARWTKRYQPWVLIHFEEYETRAVMILLKFENLRVQLCVPKNEI